jgi:hypothetical protein
MLVQKAVQFIQPRVLNYVLKWILNYLKVNVFYCHHNNQESTAID